MILADTQVMKLLKIVTICQKYHFKFLFMRCGIGTEWIVGGIERITRQHFIISLSPQVIVYGVVDISRINITESI